jgi:hypothetical protein
MRCDRKYKAKNDLINVFSNSDCGYLFIPSKVLIGSLNSNARKLRYRNNDTIQRIGNMLILQALIVCIIKNT